MFAEKSSGRVQQLYQHFIQKNCRKVQNTWYVSHILLLHIHFTTLVCARANMSVKVIIIFKLIKEIIAEWSYGIFTCNWWGKIWTYLWSLTILKTENAYIQSYFELNSLSTFIWVVSEINGKIVTGVKQWMNMVTLGHYFSQNCWTGTQICPYISFFCCSRFDYKESLKTSDINEYKVGHKSYWKLLICPSKMSLQLENNSHSTETPIAVILCRGSCISRKHNLSLKSYKVKVRLQSLVDGKKFVFWTKYKMTTGRK